MEVPTSSTVKNGDIEAQIIRNTESTGLVNTPGSECCSDQFLAKTTASILFTAIFCPFAICDVYYASAKDTCLTQSQSSHGLTIILQSYLMASGVILFLFIGAFNVGIFVFDVNLLQTQEDANVIHSGLRYCERIYHFFDLPWLILGCVLFWAYTDMSACSQSVHDYLFARFIIYIISTVGRIQRLNAE
jgi:hypothetical protein